MTAFRYYNQFFRCWQGSRSVLGDVDGAPVGYVAVVAGNNIAPTGADGTGKDHRPSIEIKASRRRGPLSCKVNGNQ